MAQAILTLILEFHHVLPLYTCPYQLFLGPKSALPGSANALPRKMSSTLKIISSQFADVIPIWWSLRVGAAGWYSIHLKPGHIGYICQVSKDGVADMLNLCQDYYIVASNIAGDDIEHEHL